jgi:ribosome-binding protein aMBF1 (putative translation factor)
MQDEIALNEKMRGLYTRDEQLANMLKMKADSLERSSKWRVIDDAAVAETMKEAEKIKILIPIIEAKLKIAKPLNKPAI